MVISINTVNKQKIKKMSKIALINMVLSMTKFEYVINKHDIIYDKA